MKTHFVSSGAPQCISDPLEFGGPLAALGAPHILGLNQKGPTNNALLRPLQARPTGMA